MKTPNIKDTTRPPNKLPGILAAFIATLLIFDVLPNAWSVDLFWTGNGATIPSAAGIGTWVTAEFSGPIAWSTSSTAVVGAVWEDNDVAHFLGSAGGTVTLGSEVTAAGIDFDPGANAFNINTNGFVLTVNGAGIANTSGNTQTITNVGNVGTVAAATTTVFLNTSTAGNATIVNLNATVAEAVGGVTQFQNASTAGSATIINEGSSFNGQGNGITQFLGTSTAGNATIINNGGTANLAGGGNTDFIGNGSTAGNASITNNGGAATGALAGFTEFTGIGSTAGNATITNNGALASGAATQPGSTEFLATSNAGAATITNNGGTFAGAAGGFTEFGGTSSAANATIISNSGTGGGLGGSTVFIATSDGGNARAITNGNASFDISGLTDAGMNIGSIEGSGNYFLGSKTLTVGGNNLDTTVSGVIQDGGGSGGVGGALTKVGAGTLTLTGTNTYTGGTTIGGGTLQLGAGGTTGTIAGNVIDNGTLAFDRSDTITFGGMISGTGNVINLGPGTSTLTGANTYTGGTTISAGTLQIGNGGTTGSIVGNVTDNAVLAFDRSDSVTFGGAISGTGDVVNLGTGTLTLTGTNTYTGGTTVSAGTLQAGSASAFSPNSAFAVNSTLDLNGFNNTIGSLSGNGTVLNNGPTTATLTTGNNNTNTTFGGVLEDGTSVLQLTKSGTGTFTLTGANTYTGTTTVNTGSLIVDGSIASAQTLVNAGGFLGGHGTIGGNLVNNGIVGQVNSPGTLTVTGNYTQNAGGTLRIGVAGLAPGQADVLAVNGHAAVAGTLQFVRLGSFNLQPGNQITFLTANNGVSGTFGTVQNGIGGTGTIVQVQVISEPNSVVLEGTQGSFTQELNGLLTPNEGAVAKMLDSARGDPRAAPLFAFLNSQPLSALPNDLNQIAPVQNTSFRATTVSHANAQISNLGGRMSAIRAGLTGFTAMGFGLPGGAVSYGEGLQGENGPEGKAAPPAPAPAPQNRWGVFFTGLGEFTDINSTPQAAGYNVNTGGFTAGVDYRLTSFLAVGLTAGYSHTGINIDQNGGNIDVNSGQFGLYTTAWTKGFYLDAAISGGPDGYNSHRNALQGSANGNTSGPSFNVLAAVGYDWTHGALTIGPTASFQFGYVGLNEFSESGSQAPLKFPNQNSESERTAFGAKATYDWQVGHLHVLPQLSAAWQHEYGDTAYSIVANLASGAGDSFTVVGPQTGRDSLLIGAGVSVLLNDRVSTYIYYDGEFARTNYLGNAVTAGVRVTF